MEGNFLSRYNNKIEEWSGLIQTDPTNKKKYESEMSQYIIKCMPFIERHLSQVDDRIHSDNVFSVKETVGLARKDIFTDYLIDVEKQNIYRQCERDDDACPYCSYSNIVHVQDTSDLVCDGCGIVVAVHINQELTYREEQETSEKIVNYSYKRENHFNEWLSQFQAQESTTIPTEVMDQLRVELRKMKIKNLEDITYAKIRGLLKKLRPK